MVMPSNKFHMVVQTPVEYHKADGQACSYEGHYKISRPGDPATVRHFLAKLGVPDFQQSIYEEFGTWIPLEKIKIGYVLEEPGRESQDNIVADILVYYYRGRQREARVLPSRFLRYSEKE